jgi:hypothetical protein
LRSPRLNRQESAYLRYESVGRATQIGGVNRDTQSSVFYRRCPEWRGLFSIVLHVASSGLVGP